MNTKQETGDRKPGPARRRRAGRFLVPVSCVLVPVLLAGCPHGRGAARTSHVVAEDGLSVAIYVGDEDVPAGTAQEIMIPAPQPPEPAPTATPRQHRSVALVDDRRTVTVEADGTLHMADVADGIELASLIVEAIDGRALDVESCARDGGLRGGASSMLGQREATFVTAQGEEITGTIRELSYDAIGPTWIVEDQDGRAHFLRGLPDKAILRGGTALEVRCQVRGPTGERRVRLVYATDDLSWEASYRVDVEVDGEAATTVVQPTFTIAGSALIGARRADVQLLVGLPGGDTAPRVAWTGDVGLGNEAVSIQPEATTLHGAFEYVYRGALSHRDDNPRVSYWRPSFTFDVWAGLSIGADEAAAHADLPAGPALVTVTRAGSSEPGRQAEAVWPEPDRDHPAGYNVPLWPSPDLIGYRERRTTQDDGQQLTEQYLFSVANQGDEPVTVWVEEELRPGAHRKIRKTWPMKPERRNDVLRFQVTIKPHKIERLGFEANYRW